MILPPNISSLEKGPIHGAASGVNPHSPAPPPVLAKYIKTKTKTVATPASENTALKKCASSMAARRLRISARRERLNIRSEGRSDKGPDCFRDGLTCSDLLLSSIL